MHIPCAYSFPMYFTIFMPFLTIIAIPPLFPFSLLCSKTWYPGISSWTDDFLSHVSYRHNMSKVCVPRSIYTFRSEIPAMFWLPMWMPDYSQRCNLSCFLFRTLADPLVRFLPFPFFPVFCILLLSSCPFLLFSVSSSFLLSPFFISRFSCAL